MEPPSEVMIPGGSFRIWPRSLYFSIGVRLLFSTFRPGPRLECTWVCSVRYDVHGAPPPCRSTCVSFRRFLSYFGTRPQVPFVPCSWGKCPKRAPPPHPPFFLTLLSFVSLHWAAWASSSVPPPFLSYLPSFPSTGPLDPPPRPHPPLFSYFPSTPSSGVLYPFAPLSPSFAFFPSYFPYFPSFLLSTGFLVPIHPTNSPTPLFSYFPSTPSSNGDRNAPAVKGKCVP